MHFSIASLEPLSFLHAFGTAFLASFTDASIESTWDIAPNQRLSKLGVRKSTRKTRTNSMYRDLSLKISNVSESDVLPGLFASPSLKRYPRPTTSSNQQHPPSISRDQDLPLGCNLAVTLIPRVCQRQKSSEHWSDYICYVTNR